MQSIVKAVRMRVSADKNRYLDGNFDLDLTYISDRIIAMSFPADGVESTYRNSIHEVSAMLNYRHFNHFMVFNLSERVYDYGILNDMVLDWCGFPDHHAPPLALLCKIVRTLHAWLEADALNVVVVHCLAGKGRTGTVIASYLIYAGLFNSAQDAMNYFALRRSLNSWGITGPSQKRYIQYFADVIQKRIVPRSNPVVLKMIVMHTIPEFTIAPMRPGICPVLQIYSIAPQGGPGRMVYSSQEGYEGDDLRSFPASERSLAFHVNRVVRGDILVVFHHVNAFYRMEQMLRFNIHTGMFAMPRMRLTKTEIDGAEGDKRFDYNFFLELVFEELPGDMGVTNHALWDSAIDEEQQLMIWKQDISSGSICFTPDAVHSTADKIQKARSLASNRGFVMGKSGWLTKKGHQVKNWKRRWFVLKDSTLAYYKSPKQTTPAGVIPVTDILRVVSDQEVSRREEVPLCFELITCKPGNTGKIVTYVISAANDADREDWIQCIEASMSSSYEIGRLYLGIIEVDFKYADGSQLASETVYCTLVFGRQRFQSMIVPSIPGRWDQTAEFTVFEEPNELVVTIYLQSDDSQLGSTTIDSNDLLQRATEYVGDDTANSETGVNTSLSLIATSSALQRFQIKGIELHLSCRFRSASDLVNAALADTQDEDMYNAGIDGDFLVLPEGKRKDRVRSASLGAVAQQALRDQRLERSSTSQELTTTTSTTENGSANSIAPADSGSTPLAIPPPLPKKPQAKEDANWIKPGYNSNNNNNNINNNNFNSAPARTRTSRMLTTSGELPSAMELNRPHTANTSSQQPNKFQIGVRPHSSTVSSAQPAATSDSPISTWFSKMTTNLLTQIDNTLGGRPVSTTLQSGSRSPNLTPNLSPTHSPSHSPRLPNSMPPPSSAHTSTATHSPTPSTPPKNSNSTSASDVSSTAPNHDFPMPPPRPLSPPPQLSPKYSHIPIPAVPNYGAPPAPPTRPPPPLPVSHPRTESTPNPVNTTAIATPLTQPSTTTQTPPPTTPSPTLEAITPTPANTTPPSSSPSFDHPLQEGFISEYSIINNYPYDDSMPEDYQLLNQSQNTNPNTDVNVTEKNEDSTHKTGCSDDANQKIAANTIENTNKADENDSEILIKISNADNKIENTSERPTNNNNPINNSTENHATTPASETDQTNNMTEATSKNETTETTPITTTSTLNEQPETTTPSPTLNEPRETSQVGKTSEVSETSEPKETTATTTTPTTESTNNVTDNADDSGSENSTNSYYSPTGSAESDDEDGPHKRETRNESMGEAEQQKASTEDSEYHPKGASEQNFTNKSKEQRGGTVQEKSTSEILASFEVVEEKAV